MTGISTFKSVVKINDEKWDLLTKEQVEVCKLLRSGTYYHNNKWNVATIEDLLAFNERGFILMQQICTERKLFVSQGICAKDIKRANAIARSYGYGRATEIKFGDEDKVLEGNGWYYRTRAGVIISHPSAYRKKGSSNMIYEPARCVVQLKEKV